MMNFNNNYKRFQNYQNNGFENNLKKDFVEQNYKVDKKRELGEKKELPAKKELNTPDTSFLEKTTKIGIDSQGQFYRK